MTDDASESPPTAVESTAADPPTVTESGAEPGKSVDPPQAEPAFAEAPPPADEPLDPQLIVLCAVLWIVAMVIFASNYQSLRVNWYLGNIKETLGPMPALGTPQEQLPTTINVDGDAIDSLVAMAPDVDVIAAVKKELSNPAQRDQRYRVLLVVVAEKIPGDAAFDLLEAVSRDLDYRLRINSYRALTQRVKTGKADKRERAFLVIHRGLTYEPVPRARSFAAKFIAEFKDTRANWVLIKTLRDADGEERALVRESALEAIRAINPDLSEEKLPFDLEATGDTFKGQIRGLEAWFTGGGGVIPPGESLDEQPEDIDEDEDVGEEGEAGESEAPQEKTPDGAKAPSDGKTGEE